MLSFSRLWCFRWWGTKAETFLRRGPSTAGSSHLFLLALATDLFYEALSLNAKMRAFQLIGEGPSTTKAVLFFFWLPSLLSSRNRWCFWHSWRKFSLLLKVYNAKPSKDGQKHGLCSINYASPKYRYLEKELPFKKAISLSVHDLVIQALAGVCL